MKICIPIEPRMEGGMYTFVGNLRAYLDAHGVAHTAVTGDTYDVLFVNSWAVPYETVRRAKIEHPHICVVQRVDGSSRDYGGYRRGDALQARVNMLADVTVFQSRYSRLSTTAKYHVVDQDGPVIYNPVDLSVFHPDGVRLQFAPDRVAVACASWSTNPGKGTREIDALAARHPEIDFVLCGRFEGITIRPNVIRLGHVSRAEMAQALRSCAAFLNLSGNDPAPNVVIEALACGTPVLYRDSGGVPELVGECGLAVTTGGFRRQLDGLLECRESLSRAARDRAEREFSPDVVFPKYLAAMESAVRRPLPTAWTVLRLASRGFPVLGGAGGGRSDATPPATVKRRAAGPRDPGAPCRVAWVTYDTFQKTKKDFSELDSFTGMRAGNVGRWINANTDRVRTEIYHPARSYDAVIFQKMMQAPSQREVERLQATGTAVIFDANVNYYEIWGDYVVPGTKPTERQRRDAIWMTARADWVVADSSYLATIARKFTDRVTWIPDNVDPEIYAGRGRHQPTGPLTLVWSGISKKAAHLGLLRGILSRLSEVTLILVCDDPVSADIQSAARNLTDAPGISVRVLPFSHPEYARTLSESDAIISPKYLINGYEMAHTEYKITLGMAVGLPAVASPQPSYVEAISHLGGGIVARTPEEWVTALSCLAERAERRAAMGELAARTVRERYATPVVARRYLDLLVDVLDRTRPRTAVTVC